MIPSQDFHEQKRIYTYLGKGDWRIVGYCDQPSITMENILNHSRQTFGIGGATMQAFEPAEGLEWDHERRRVLEITETPHGKRARPYIALEPKSNFAPPTSSHSAESALPILRDLYRICDYLLWHSPVGQQKAQAIIDEIHNGKHGHKTGFLVQADEALNALGKPDR